MSSLHCNTTHMLRVPKLLQLNSTTQLSDFILAVNWMRFLQVHTLRTIL